VKKEQLTELPTAVKLFFSYFTVYLFRLDKFYVHQGFFMLYFQCLTSAKSDFSEVSGAIQCAETRVFYDKTFFGGSHRYIIPDFFHSANVRRVDNR
jgi:hypothetical protein